MKFYFFAIIFLLMIINKIALAEEFPTFGKVYHKTENTMLDYSCKKIQPGKINCDFTQTSIWKNKKDELEREIETIKEKVGKEKFKASNVASPEQCELYKNSLAIVEGKKNKDTLKDSKIADSVENMMKTLKNSSSRQRQDFKKTLGLMADEIKPGITPLYLDNIAEEFILDNKAKPGFKGYDNFPNTLCVSINNEVVHGIPCDTPLKNGDIVSIDCGVLKDGFYGDHAYTFSVGEVSNEVQELLDVTKKSLYKGIDSMKESNRIGDIGDAIESYIKIHGYGIVRELVGHGLGQSLHELPEVPNYGKKGTGKFIKNGLVLAIEPMINLGSEKIKLNDDGWTFVTVDGLQSAHFEHNIAVIDSKPELLSTFKYIYQALGIESNEEDKFNNFFNR